ncbi:MAG: hypothetical protein ACRBN8_12705 [Nannocystales bacterium]
MNTRLLRTSVLIVSFPFAGCVQSGVLDETGTENTTDPSGSETQGASSEDSGPGTMPSGDSDETLESGSSGDGGGFSCVDYSPPALDCGTNAGATASVGYSVDTLGPLRDTECTVVRIQDANEGSVELEFACPTGIASLFVSTHLAELPVPFSEGDSVLLTVQSQGSSSVVRSLSGRLLLGYVAVEGFEADVDLGAIEIVHGLSGCPAEAESSASCTEDGSVSTARTALKVASGGPTGATVFEGQSEIIEQGGRSFLFVVDVARELVCWDEDCTTDAPWLEDGGAMAFLLVAQ